METQKIKYGKFELTIKEDGFCLTDTSTDELLIDASMLYSYWPVEIEISTTNRDFYISNSKSPKVVFGFTQGE